MPGVGDLDEVAWRPEKLETRANEFLEREDGVERSALFQFSINVPKDSNLELWIDDLGAYRRRAPQ